MLKLVDVSFYNTISDHALLKQNAFAVLIKTSQGIAEDTSFRDHLAKEQAVGQRVGLWHFYHPDMAPKPQIDTFLKIYNSLKQKPAKIALDCEESNWVEITADQTRIPHTVLPPSINAYSIWLAQWLAAVENDTGIIPDIYTRATWWDPWVLPSRTIVGTTTLPDWSHYNLWVANYYAKKPALPRDWKTWLFWQWGTSITPGVKTAVDSDWFDGTEAQLDLIFNMPTPAPVPTPTPTPAPVPVPTPAPPSDIEKRLTNVEMLVAKIDAMLKTYK